MRKAENKSAGSIRRRARTAGFTLLELMIVITVILILMALGAGKYQQSLLQSREAVLKQNLFVMREAINNYTRDHSAAPTSLEELVSAQYLRKIPIDPMTGLADWRLEYEREPLNPEKNTGISNVFSNSGKTSPFDNTQYSEW